MFHFKSIKAKGFTRLSQLILICGGLVLLAPATSIAAVDCQLVSKNTYFNYLNIDISKPVNERSISQKTTSVFDCSRDYVYIRLSSNKSEIPGLPGVYATNLRGIGISYRIRYDSSCRSRYSDEVFLTPGLELQCTKTPNHPMSFVVRISLVKLTENYEVGLLNDYPKFSITYSDQQNSIVSGKTINDILAPLNSIPVERYGCTINTPNINFNLGKQPQKDFTGIGSTSGENTQQMTLACHSNTRYSLFINGITEPGHNSVLKLTQESGAASGVGVQLLLGSNKTPVQIGSYHLAGSTPINGSHALETIDIPITARYYQTAHTVTPGSANASATFTMTYQ